MLRLPRPVTMRMSRIPARTASSTTYWMAGRSTTGSISLGCALVAGRKRVPRPAAGMTALVTDFDTGSPGAGPARGMLPGDGAPGGRTGVDGPMVGLRPPVAYPLVGRPTPSEGEPAKRASRLRYAGTHAQRVLMATSPAQGSPGDRAMPTYEYRCKDCRHELEAQQSFSDDPLTECPSCGGLLKKKFSSVGISFKGSGFYKTDSRTSSSSKSKGEGSGSSESKSSSDTATASKDSSSGSSDSGSSSTTSSGTSGSSSTPATKSPAATPA